jgi:hypothetical protein
LCCSSLIAVVLLQFFETGFCSCSSHKHYEQRMRNLSYTLCLPDTRKMGRPCPFRYLMTSSRSGIIIKSMAKLSEHL